MGPRLIVDAAPTSTAGPADSFEAVAAIDGSVSARLEGHLGLLAAAAADDVEHLTLCSRGTREAATATTATISLAAVAALSATGATALGVGEAARGVELLVVCAKCELLSAVSAHQCLVCERHLKSLL
jgi:hypothetical protein